jgi:biopolymer transport protein TolQ
MEQQAPQAVPTGTVEGGQQVMQQLSGAIDATATGMGVTAHDLSVYGLFIQADWIVKAVMIMLLLASIWSWAIIIHKLIRLRTLRALAKQFEDAFWSGGSLEELYDRVSNRPTDPMASIFVAAMREWRRSAAKGLLGNEALRESLRDRIERVMNIALGREVDQLERYMTFLASVGSAAPFVGLFGTVWGIMNSFAAIAGSKNTSLAVVAPGIAEALFATALGLVAAIPAVLAFNKLNSDITRYGNRLEAFAGEFGAILSRQLEEKH